MIFQRTVDVHFWISVIFLCLILIPIIILFIIFYQNISESVRLSQKSIKRVSQSSTTKKASRPKQNSKRSTSQSSTVRRQKQNVRKNVPQSRQNVKRKTSSSNTSKRLPPSAENVRQRRIGSNSYHSASKQSKSKIAK